MILRREWSWTIDAPRGRVWPYLADTNAINRLAGLPPVAYAYAPQPDGSIRAKASLRYGPLRVSWNEPPFAWSAPEFHDVERRYENGPLRRFRTRTALTAVGDRTEVCVSIELEPRSRLYAPLLPAIAERGRRGMERAIRSVRAKLGPEAGGTAPSVVPQRFAPLLAQGFERDELAKIAHFLTTAHDSDVARIRPFALADRLGLARRTTLRLCLAATRLGLLDLSWSVLCSSCGGSKARLDTLGQLGETHCDACNIRFDPVFDRSVEVTFDARPLGRTAEVPTFCFAGPGASAHVLAQASVAANGGATIEADLDPGHYLARAMGDASVSFAAETFGDDAPLALHLREAGLDGVPGETRSGRRSISIANHLTRPAVLRVESSVWPDTIATAAQVTAMQEFRDLFASDVLAPGKEMAIRSLAILFTDVVGSTEMYRTNGDAPAFRTVSDHFDAIRGVIAPRGGAIVKTIGDAVMAVFDDPASCVDAALRLNGAVAHLRCGATPLLLRVGLHVGPCVVMRANDRLDYFGTTVNLAARLEATASAGEIAMSESDAERPGIAEAIATLAEIPVRTRVVLKGIAQAVSIVCLKALES